MVWPAPPTCRIEPRAISPSFACPTRETDNDEESHVEPIQETRYALGADGGQIAYQIVGSGPMMIGFNPLVTIDVMWEEPTVVRFLERLASFSRLVWFDPRGAGSSASFLRGEGRV